MGQSGYINVGEQFKNCADVQVIDGGSTGSQGGGSPSTPAPSPTPTVPTPSVSTPRRRRAPTDAPNSFTGSCSGQPCPSASHCRSKWGHCGSTSNYCNSESIWTPNGCSGTSEPSSEPAAEPETEPQPEPETGTETANCVVAALGLSRGVSSSNCLTCVNGYQFWPCNERTLCTCSSPCSWDGHWHCGVSF